MRGPKLWKAGHNLVLSMHRAESFPKAVELAILGLQTILVAESVFLFSKRFSPENGTTAKARQSTECPCEEHGKPKPTIERTIWPREKLCLIFCAHYENAIPADEELIFDMVLEQLLCAGEHLPAEPDSNIDNSLLSKREREVLPLIAAAKTNGQIAKELGISERTVEKHVASILDKTGLGNRKLVIAASKGGRVSSPRQYNNENFSS